jgi:hypothetical protein
MLRRRGRQPRGCPGPGGRLEFADLPTIFANGVGFVPVLRYRRDPGLVVEGGFAETRDGGTTWSAPRLALSGTGTFPTMAVAGSGTLLVLSGDQRTLASGVDHGRTWTTRRSGLLAARGRSSSLTRAASRREGWSNARGGWPILWTAPWRWTPPAPPSGSQSFSVPCRADVRQRWARVRRARRRSPRRADHPPTSTRTTAASPGRPAEAPQRSAA